MRDAEPPRRGETGASRLFGRSPWAWAALALGCLASARAETPAPAPALEPREGAAVESQLAPGQTHTYGLELEAGRFLHLVVDQRGVDVEAALLGPDGERLVASDRPTSYEGPEDLLALTERSGTYRLVVEALPDVRSPGRYEARVETLRPATGTDGVKAEAARLFSAGDDLRRRGEARKALEALRQALPLWEEAADSFRQGETLLRIGDVHADLLGERVEAEELYRRAGARFADAGNARWQALASNHLGIALYELGETGSAIEEYEAALRLARSAGYRRAAAILCDHLGRAHSDRGEPQKAIDFFERSLELLDAEKDPDPRARALHNLGVLYRQLGEWDEARDDLEEAERSFARQGLERLQAASLNQLGQLAQDRGELAAALETYRRVLAIRRRTRDSRGEAVTLGKIGRLHQELGELEEAASHYRQALALLDEKRPRELATIELYRGSLLARLARPGEALDAFRRALALFRGADEKEGEAETLLGLARAARLLGRLEEARADARDGLAIFESVRPRPLRQDLRISFFATVQRHYDFYVDLLMELARGAPAAGYDGAALEASEMARSRALLDMLTETGLDLRRGIDPGLLDLEREVQARLNRTEYRRAALLARTGAAAQLEPEVRTLIEQLEAVKGEIRRQASAYADVTQPRPLGLDEIHRQVVDEGSLLLEYKLGDERSFLWAVTRDALASFELAGREELGELVHTAYDRLSASRRLEVRLAARSTLCALARQLLEPAAALLAGKRLLIVPDGALSYLPFAALPDPGLGGFAGSCAAAPPLAAEHEITYLPSASVLATQRRELAGRAPAPGLLAVMADPVFSAADERVPHAPPSAGAAAAPSFPRLAHSRREAEALLALVPPEKSYLALGFDVNKDAVLGGRLRGYRLVHLATHGVLNADHPDLSSLVLSLVDENGAPRDGFLRVHEIYNLDLSAELVVLSACETALGKEVRGEGLLGFTRAFLYAGAKRVLVSLWKVGDRGTAELMSRFYRHLLDDGLRPAEALRRTQLSMLGDETWGAPFFWAGFVLLGEPR